MSHKPRLYPSQLCCAFSAALLLIVSAANAGTRKAAGGDPPGIGEQPLGRAVTEGGHVALSVVASGTAPLSYQWSRGGRLLTNNSRVSGTSGAVLNIDAVQTNDSGNYFVIVTNSSGSITSAPASVVVTPPLLQLVPLGSTGAILTVAGQVGDVYRIEVSVNFGPFATNGYITNVNGSAQYLDRDMGGGFRRLRAVFDHALPILYAPAVPQPMNMFRVYGKLNEVWRLQSTPDFRQWIDLAIVTNTTGWVRFQEASPPPAPHRFYRIAPPP